jgi:hypothetical protein
VHDGVIMDNNYAILNEKQKNEILITLNKPSNISQININQFTGERQGQCGEVDNPVLHQPIKKFEFELFYFNEGDWKLLKTNKISFTEGSMHINYSVAVAPIKTDKILVKPIYDTLEKKTIHIQELSVNNNKIQACYLYNAHNGKPIIPAQQTCILEIGEKQKQYLWMGDLWGSASDNIKGHDYQFWSKPLQFYKNGNIKPIQWAESFTLTPQ